MTPGSDEFNTVETPKGEPPRRRVPRPVMLAAATALVVVAGGGVAAAATLSPAPAPSTSGAATQAPAASPTSSPAPPGRERRHPGPGMGLHAALHGEFVVPDGRGGYVTRVIQYGEVTAADQDSVTVRSEDGHTREYTLDGETRTMIPEEDRDTLQAGDVVEVMATVNGQAAVADAVLVDCWEDRNDDSDDDGGRRDRSGDPDDADEPDDREEPDGPNESARPGAMDDWAEPSYGAAWPMSHRPL